ncbi:Oidioi.mRNA.OKI2018_I69.chr2.g4405.t1.cds [Oikopleura dioica]|uniref:Oidioi.mRNA.OKI2018_I69.chr2.g4405.t1.cds n=1 Tax=Oikopleura dioica TaxID=34765 RepID=A0ABN7T3N8_OIKDI|nr:Oidioi.mRNA.OKI2018_I69.chr2.g4405.t1.cds [Oikopleura dioica]
METLSGSRTAKREGNPTNVDPRKSYLQMGSSKKMNFETTSGATAKSGTGPSSVSTPRGPASKSLRQKFMQSNISFGQEKTTYQRDSQQLGRLPRSNEKIANDFRRSRRSNHISPFLVFSVSVSCFKNQK